MHDLDLLDDVPAFWGHDSGGYAECKGKDEAVPAEIKEELRWDPSKRATNTKAKEAKEKYKNIVLVKNHCNWLKLTLDRILRIIVDEFNCFEMIQKVMIMHRFARRKARLINN